MSRADRYVLREILIPLIVSVVAVVALVFLFQARRLMGAALGLGLRLEDAAVIFVSALPPFLVLAVPIAYLLAVLVGLGRLSQDREIIALRAAGASPWRLARMPLFLGVVVSLGCLPIAMYGEPVGLRMLHERLVDVSLRNLTGAIRPGVFNEDFKGSAVYASERTDDGRLQDVFVFDERDPERPMLVVSERGGFTVFEDGIVFELEGGEMHLGEPGGADTYDRMRFDRAELGLDAAQELARRTKFVSPIGRMSGPEMRAFARKAKLTTPLGRRVEKTYWRRYAFPAMAFVFGLVAAAIALSGGPRARARNAILGVLTVVLYYALTRVADIVVVKYDDTPFLGAWVPNLMMLAIGAWALVRGGRPK